MSQMLSAVAVPVDAVCPSVLSRIAARLCARHLDRLVASGVSPHPGSALDVHVLRLGSASHRERLAAELRRRGTGDLCSELRAVLAAL